MIHKLDYLVVIFSVSVGNICMGRDVGIESDMAEELDGHSQTLRIRQSIKP